MITEISLIGPEDQDVILIYKQPDDTKLEIKFSKKRWFIMLSLFQGGFGNYVYFDTRSLAKYLGNQGDYVDDLTIPIPVVHIIGNVLDTDEKMLSRYTLNNRRNHDHPQFRGILAIFIKYEPVPNEISPETLPSTDADFQHVVIEFMDGGFCHYGIFLYLPIDVDDDNRIDISHIHDQSYRLMCQAITLGSAHEIKALKVLTDIIRSYITDDMGIKQIIADMFYLDWEI